MNTNFDFSGRLINLYEKISAEEVDALLITKIPNVTYFSGFRGDSSALFVGKNIRKLITDGRYIEQALTEAKNFTLVEQTEGFSKKVAEEIKISGCKKIGFEGLVMTVAQHNYLKKNLDGVEFKSIELDTLRQVKDAAEIKNIRKACEIADNAFKKILEVIKPGVREIEVAAELEYFMRRLGSEKPAFTTIVASGWRGSLPHGIATDKKICAGEFVTMDFGATFNGYCSDITRTIAVGKISDEQRKIYNAVLNAQLYGLEIITAGKGGVEIDAAVRELATEKIDTVIRNPDKLAREAALEEVKAEVVETLAEKFPAEDFLDRASLDGFLFLPARLPALNWTFRRYRLRLYSVPLAL